MIGKCWLCGNEHKMLITPATWDGVYCPYDPDGKSKLPEGTPPPLSVHVTETIKTDDKAGNG